MQVSVVTGLFAGQHNTKLHGTIIVSTYSRYSMLYVRDT